MSKSCANSTCQNIIKNGTYCAKCRKRKRLYGDINFVKPRGNKELWKLSKNAGAKPKYVVDTTILNQWSPALAWLLGWTITDGCVENKTRWLVSWMLKDREPLEIIQQLFKSNKPIEESYKKNKETGEKKLYYRLRLCGKHISQKFIDLGVEPNKTFITKIPSMSPDLIWHFFRGVMEGDGTITLRNGGITNREGYQRLTVEIACGHKKFLEEIAKWIEKCRIRFVDAEGKSKWNLEIDCSNAVNFLKQVYQDSEGLRLNRKYEKWQKFIDSEQTYR